MARARNIKPGFFKNYDLADLGPHIQILFAGLWCLADREGRLEDKPRFIKAELFPYYEVDVNGGLTLLHESGFVKRYSVNGVSLIQVEGFHKHQSPHKTEKPSVLPGIEHASPAKPCATRVTVDSPLNNVDSPKHFGGNPPDSLIPDSLIPDSLIPSLPTLSPGEKDASPSADAVAPQAAGESEIEMQGSFFAEDPAGNPPVATPVKPAAANEDFETAWGFYPKRAGGNSKTEALKAWTARVKQGKRPDDMIEGSLRYAKFCEAKGIIGTEFVKQASTFFGPSLHFEEAWDIPAAQPHTANGRPVKFDPLAYIDRNRNTQETSREQADDYIDM